MVFKARKVSWDLEAKQSSTQAVVLSILPLVSIYYCYKNSLNLDYCANF